jgi:ElaB/YqjD/DUF883 family membrane-anchored ribosome-binding protein
MNIPEHTFPLPENVTHTLDDIKSELPEQSFMDQICLSARNNPWQAVAVGGFLGLLLGVYLAKSRD